MDAGVRIAANAARDRPSIGCDPRSRFHAESVHAAAIGILLGALLGCGEGAEQGSSSGGRSPPHGVAPVDRAAGVALSLRTHAASASTFETGRVPAAGQALGSNAATAATAATAALPALAQWRAEALLPAEPSAWFAAIDRDADPGTRRNRLEVWAQNPTQTLDIVAAAMVDEDESIRERAQQILDNVFQPGR